MNTQDSFDINKYLNKDMFFHLCRMSPSIEIAKFSRVSKMWEKWYKIFAKLYLKQKIKSETLDYCNEAYKFIKVDEKGYKHICYNYEDCDGNCWQKALKKYEKIFCKNYESHVEDMESLVEDRIRLFNKKEKYIIGDFYVSKKHFEGWVFQLTVNGNVLYEERMVDKNVVYIADHPFYEIRLFDRPVDWNQACYAKLDYTLLQDSNSNLRTLKFKSNDIYIQTFKRINNIPEDKKLYYQGYNGDFYISEGRFCKTDQKIKYFIR